MEGREIELMDGQNKKCVCIWKVRALRLGLGPCEGNGKRFKIAVKINGVGHQPGMSKKVDKQH